MRKQFLIVLLLIVTAFMWGGVIYIASQPDPYAVTDNSSFLPAHHGKVLGITTTPTGTYSADSYTINAGQSTILHWNIANAVAAWMNNNIGNVPVSGQVTVSPVQTTDYTIHGTNSLGVSWQSTLTVTVNNSTGSNPVVATPPPSGTFTASSPTITAGQSTTLSWNISNANFTKLSYDNQYYALSGSVPVTPIVTTTYTLTAWGWGGTQTFTQTVTVNAGTVSAPTGSITADSTTLTIGQTTTLRWSVSNATSATLNYDSQSSSAGALSGGVIAGSLQITPTKTTTYTIAATGPGGTQSFTVTVTVNGTLTVPIGTFTVSMSSIGVGQCPALSWNISSATSISIDNGIGVVSANNTVNVCPTKTTTYTLSATNSAGTKTFTQTVTVAATPPTGTFTVDSANLTAGQSTTLRWNISGATSLSIDNDIGTVTNPGTKTITPVKTTNYALTTTGPGGNQTFYVAVYVTGTTGTGNLDQAINSVDKTSIIPQNGTLYISGWAADPALGMTPVSRVDVLLDGTTVLGQATLGLPRTDVTGYPNSGWSYTISGTNLPALGNHTVSASVYGASGQKVQLNSKTINIVSPPTVASPSGTFDANIASIIIGQCSTLSWNISNATSFSIDNNIGSISASGSKSVCPTVTTTYILTATGSGGTRQFSKAITVGSVPAPIANFGTFGNGSTVISINAGQSATLTWDISNATSLSINNGIGTVAAKGSTTVSPTTDTQYTLTALWSGGKQEFYTTVTINVPKLTLVGYFDKAYNSADKTTTVPQSGQIFMSGWAAGFDPGTGIALAVDGLGGQANGVPVVVKATTGLSRPDVTSYQNSGWTATMSAANITPGTHQLWAFAYDSTGLHALNNSPKTITVTAGTTSTANPETPTMPPPASAPTGYLDVAYNAADPTSTNIPATGQVYVSGWAADPALGTSPVSKVSVAYKAASGNIVIGNATLGLLRSDVTNYPKSGWSFVFNAANLGPGTYTLIALVPYTSGGATVQLAGSKIITITPVVSTTNTVVPVTGYFDEAYNAADHTTTVPQNGQIFMHGWAANIDNVNGVQLMFDSLNNGLGQIPANLSRPDVTAYPNSGWALTVSAANIPAGIHKLYAAVYDTSGSGKLTYLSNSPKTITITSLTDTNSTTTTTTGTTTTTTNTTSAGPFVSYTITPAGTVPFSATAAFNVGYSAVSLTFYMDNIAVKTCVLAITPLSKCLYGFTAAAGSTHSFYATATDSAGNIGKSGVYTYTFTSDSMNYVEASSSAQNTSGSTDNQTIDMTQSTKTTQTVSAHPAGSYVKDSTGVIYYLNALGTKDPFPALGNLVSWGATFSQIVTANTADLALPTGRIVPPKDGSIVDDHGTIYQIVSGQRQGFTTEDSFLSSGHSYSEVIYNCDTSFMESMPPINANFGGGGGGGLDPSTDMQSSFTN